jgi:hypothetical protein
VLLLLALLTWLLLRGTAYAVTLRDFDDFALAEASLHRDVLQGVRPHQSAVVLGQDDL